MRLFLYTWLVFMFAWCWYSEGFITTVASMIVGFIAFLLIYAVIIWRIK